MAPRQPQFDLERFEHVAATPGTVLLRVAGRWTSRRRRQLDAPILVAGDGTQLSPLPGPDDPAPEAGPDTAIWRVAFSAPAALACGPFTLGLGEVAVGLPGPQGPGAGRPGPAAPVAEPEPEPE